MLMQCDYEWQFALSTEEIIAILKHAYAVPSEIGVLDMDEIGVWNSLPDASDFSPS
jgi:hypothetical protein